MNGFMKRAIACLLAVILMVGGFEGEARAANPPSAVQIYYPNSAAQGYAGNGTARCEAANYNNDNAIRILSNFVTGDRPWKTSVLYVDLVAQNLNMQFPFNGNFERFAVTAYATIPPGTQELNNTKIRTFIYNPDRGNPYMKAFEGFELDEAGRIEVPYDTRGVNDFSLRLQGTVVSKKYGKLPIVDVYNKQEFSITCYPGAY